jgi:aspartate kinase
MTGVDGNPVTRAVVLKFGGTSIASAPLIGRAADLILQEPPHLSPVVVMSAMGQTTDALLEAAVAAAHGERGRWSETVSNLEREHLLVCRETGSAQDLESVVETIREQFSKLRCWLDQAAESGHLGGPELDQISSLGEVCSAALMALALRGRGAAAVAVDGKDVILTDSSFGEATPLENETKRRIEKLIAPRLEAGTIPVVSGFRGATRDGRCTTLGRGGSDSTATVIGSLLPALEVRIYTDVDGVMTADPRLVPEARVIAALSYQEAAELAFFGARVLHANSMDMPRRHRVRVCIRNSVSPGGGGTVIGPRMESRPGVRAVTHTGGARLFTARGGDGVSFSKLAVPILKALDFHRIQTLMVTQSSAANVMCLAVAGQHGERVAAELARLEASGGLLAAVEISQPVGVVVAVGDSMRGTPGIAAKLFTALAERKINVMAISQGASELSVSAAVGESDLVEAVRAIHSAFELERSQPSDLNG